MATAASATHLPPVGAHERDEVGRQLQATLVELIDLSLVGKQFHWTVTGPNFRSLHLQLDELVDAWRELSDTVAERAVALGSFPDGQASAVVEGPGRPALAVGPIPDAEVVNELLRRVAEVSERTRARAERLAELDLASQDVLIDVLRALEQQQWMLRAQLGHARVA